jgi:hypothetical protein
VAATGATSGETIVAAFDLSAPNDVEEKIAIDFKLEIVSQVTLPSLGWRIVRYRVPDLRPVDTIVDRMRADQRVVGAQVNIVYQRLDPHTPELEVGSLKKTPDAGSKGEQEDKRPAAIPPLAHSLATLLKPPGRGDLSDVARRHPTLSAKITVGDVISGGF